MAIIKSRNKKTGILYAYESESYWDKEKQQPRSRRKIIGKVDEETGEIIPTGKKGRLPATSERDSDEIHSENTDYKKLYEECKKNIETSNQEILCLKKQLAESTIKVEKLEAVLTEIRKLVKL